MRDLSTIIVLGAVGAGAYFLVRRMGPAAPAAAATGALPPVNSPAAQQQWKANDAALWKSVGGLLGGLVGSFGSSSSPSVSVPGSGASGGYIGDEAVYVPDAAAVNPPGGFSDHYSYGLDYT